jgi:hypothetical protein
MIAWKYKLWRNAGAAALVIGATACGQTTPADQQPSEPPAAAGASGEAAIGESGGEHGEAGVATAYAGIDGPARTALRLQHLKGFVLIAHQIASTQPAEAAVLVGQGVLEVYDPAADQFGALDAAPVRAAGENAAQIGAALAAIDSARSGLEYNAADVAARMTDLSAGLYSHVIQADFVDPIEYQHALGAALSARDALVSHEQSLKRTNARAYAEGLAELDRLIALWPGPTAPETPTANQQVQVQASRVRLALSPFLS